MRLNLLIADFAYTGTQRVCLFDGPSTTTAGEERGEVGREQSCRFVIAGDQSVSRRHCEVLFRNGRFLVRNLSRFGTLVGERTHLSEPGSEEVIENNDRIVIGGVELLATILPGASTDASRHGTLDLGGEAPPLASSTLSIDERFLAESQISGAAIATPRSVTGSREALNISGDQGFSLDEHDQAQLARAPVGNRSGSGIPEDLDLEVLLGLKQRDPVTHASTALPQSGSGDPLDSHRQSRTSDRVADQQDRHQQPLAQVDASPTDATETILQVLLAAGIEDARARSLAPTLTAQTLGELLSSMIAALSIQFAVRDSFKRAFRLATTEMKAVGNNPLRGGAAPGDILSDLLEPPLGFVGGSAAVQDAALDLQIHQAAVADCIRTSFESMLEHFEPSRFEQDQPRSSKSLLNHLTPGARDAAAWKQFKDTFETRFSDRHRAFLTTYLERFGVDYETSTRKVQASSPKRASVKKGK
jgi:type VI secretion system FHA domain protein